MSYVTISQISKRFGATQALDDVSITLERGEVHGILGENGAGKSTLMKVLSGIVNPDGGHVTIEGTSLSFGDPRAARAAGLAMAYQELSSPHNVSVATKILAPGLPRSRFGTVSRRRLREEASARLAQWDKPEIDPETFIADLSLADRQHVELVAAMARARTLLVLDEPTAALPDPEWLFRQIDKLRGHGISTIYISHKLAEIRRICDRGTVLRNGRVAAGFERDEMDESRLVELMIGRTLTTIYPAKRGEPTTDVAVEVHGLAVHPRLRGVDLTIGAGEIVGVAALEGQGQRELFYCLAGLEDASAGTVQVTGTGGLTPFSIVPEDRKAEALFMAMPAQFNIAVPLLKQYARGPLVRRADELRFARSIADQANLPREMLAKRVSQLSGGNQQKVVFGRALSAQPDCLLLFDPTRGVDAATKVEIYRMAREFASTGRAVLIYSTETPELVGLCDRVYSLYQGQIVAELAGDDITETLMMNAALGRTTEVFA